MMITNPTPIPANYTLAQFKDDYIENQIDTSMKYQVGATGDLSVTDWNESVSVDDGVTTFTIAMTFTDGEKVWEQTFDFSYKDGKYTYMKNTIYNKTDKEDVVEYTMVVTHSFDQERYDAWEA